MKTRFNHYLDDGYTHVREISETQYAAIIRLAFTHAIIVIEDGDYLGYCDRWCYHTEDDAVKALAAWDGIGEPVGWHRHPESGRRREIEPDGSIKEWISP